MFYLFNLLKLLLGFGPVCYVNKFNVKNKIILPTEAKINTHIQRDFFFHNVNKKLQTKV